MSYKYKDNEFKSVPSWVRQLTVDLYGVNPDSPAFIRPYELGKPIQDLLSQIGPDGVLGSLWFQADVAIQNTNQVYKSQIILSNKSPRVGDFIFGADS